MADMGDNCVIGLWSSGSPSTSVTAGDGLPKDVKSGDNQLEDWNRLATSWIPLRDNRRRLGNKGVLNLGVNTTTEPLKDCVEVPAHHLLFQIANICFVLSYAIPNGKYCILFMHSMLAFGCLLAAVWSWSFICGSGMIG
ncbi:unnamed protein product [Medioppia subpectinata]|uniref:POPDC1-3 domain-containing protein n=1 Tax=Medioppia subpectinata TaxID=1979941 RepID=A0A7R9QCP1_9ACAR|nr:unnamed protein product [Medioppia subpectinata]CAG2118487.1 unnamed protein product [Medioppia subpectinata]